MAQNLYSPGPVLNETSRRGEPVDDSLLEELIHGKSRILGRKLDILAAEIWWRLQITSRNLKGIDDDKAVISEMLERVGRMANYQLREHRDKDSFYRKLFELETEARSQQTECWRDVVLVMKDFLYAWEAHEQARARAVFLKSV